MLNWAEILEKAAGCLETWDDPSYRVVQSQRFITDGCVVEIIRNMMERSTQIVITEATRVEELRG